jgi:hypothetical protein
VLIRHRTSLWLGIKSIISAASVALALFITALPASAQNFFEALFGRVWSNAPSAYADPSSQLNPFGEAPATGVVFCVRLCDGRYFPMQRHGGVTPAQACSSSCPAAGTKIYNGSAIEHAVAADGKRYTELGTAFVYREKIVPGCTCNGRDAFGLVTPSIEADTTLHPGDIVATNTGLMAYNGAPGGKQANFTPVESYNGISAELRRRLTETKVAPVTEKPAAPVARQAEATPRNTKNKRAQAER